MNIVMVLTNYYPGWGGAENQARKQAALLVQRGHSVRVVTWQRSPDWPLVDEVDGVTVVRVPRYLGQRLGAVRSLVAMIRTLWREARWADAMAAHQVLRAAYIAGFVAAILRTRLVVKPAITANAVDSDLRALAGSDLGARLRRALTYPLRKHAIVAAMTAEIERDVRRIGFRQVTRIPNGVEDPGVPDRSRLREELFAPLGIPTDSRVVVAAGRLVAWKGFDLLIDAFSRIDRAAIDAGSHLIVVGSGGESDALQRVATERGVAHLVHFVPASTRSTDYLAGADVVAIPSDFEGMSNVLLEAMVLAVPVVATRVSGAVDLIRHGINGHLVSVRDVEALTASLTELMTEPGDLGVQARQTVLAMCELGHVVDLYENVFRDGPG